MNLDPGLFKLELKFIAQYRTNTVGIALEAVLRLVCRVVRVSFFLSLPPNGARVFR